MTDEEAEIRADYKYECAKDRKLEAEMKEKKKIPIIYIAGPYRSKYGLPGRILNIYRARKLAKRVWAAGYYAICPHMNSALMDGVAPDQQFLDGDIEILKKCDAILMMKGFRNSSGAIEEREQASRAGITIIHEINDRLYGGDIGAVIKNRIRMERKG